VLTIFNFASSKNDVDPEYNKYIDILVANEIEVKKIFIFIELFLFFKTTGSNFKAEVYSGLPDFYAG
jgi:hypothetical protein